MVAASWVLEVTPVFRNTLRRPPARFPQSRRGRPFFQVDLSRAAPGQPHRVS
jgi:hypothetical protein